MTKKVSKILKEKKRSIWNSLFKLVAHVKANGFFLAEGFCSPCWTREFQQGTGRLLDLVSYLGFTGRGGKRRKKEKGVFLDTTTMSKTWLHCLSKDTNDCGSRQQCPFFFLSFLKEKGSEELFVFSLPSTPSSWFFFQRIFRYQVSECACSTE